VIPKKSATNGIQRNYKAVWVDHRCVYVAQSCSNISLSKELTQYLERKATSFSIAEGISGNDF